MILVYCTTGTMIKKTLALFAGLIHCLLPALDSLPSNNINSITNEVQTISRGNCHLNCTADYFDEGKDCHETRSGQCNCIGHCCLALDCRPWGTLVQCRRKCHAVPTRFGKRSHQANCDKITCDQSHYDPHWDSRGAHDDRQRNCVQHCCYAFDCRKALGYCRQACGVEVWVTPRTG